MPTYIWFDDHHGWRGKEKLCAIPSKRPPQNTVSHVFTHGCYWAKPPDRYPSHQSCIADSWNGPTPGSGEDFWRPLLSAIRTVNIVVLFTFVNPHDKLPYDFAIQTQFSAVGVSHSSPLVRSGLVSEPSFFFRERFNVARRHISTPGSPEFPLLSLFAPQERKIRSFVFNHLHTLFSLFGKSETLSPFFSATSTLFAKNTRGGVPVHAKWAFPLGDQVASAPANSVLSSPIFQSAGHFVFISLHRYFGLSREKPYPRTYHPMAKRYRTGCILRMFGASGFVLANSGLE